MYSIVCGIATREPERLARSDLVPLSYSIEQVRHHQSPEATGRPATLRDTIPLSSLVGDDHPTVDFRTPKTDTADNGISAPAVTEADHPRAIRSFVRRSGRQTVAQTRAITELWPRYGIEFHGSRIDLADVFGRVAPRTLEIGFGDGDSLVTMASRHPERDYLGLEVHEPGVGHCLLAAEALDLRNLRIISHDAVEVLSTGLVANDLDEVLIYFPDPWPKTRHHKRRLIQPHFVSLLSRRVRPGGHVRLATDWAPYAEWMLEVLSASADFVNAASDGRFMPRPLTRPETKFERRGHRLGHRSHDLDFVRR